MYDVEVIKTKMEDIYNNIPKVSCKHCHDCCGPIIWFKTEEILMKDYMKKHKIENIKFTSEEFKKNDMKCPFLKNDRCSIYQVRPIVCRLQGNTPDLPCRYNKNTYLPEESIKKIKNDFYELNKKIQGSDMFFSTRKIIKI